MNNYSWGVSGNALKGSFALRAQGESRYARGEFLNLGF